MKFFILFSSISSFLLQYYEMIFSTEAPATIITVLFTPFRPLIQITQSTLDNNHDELKSYIRKYKQKTY